MFNNREIAAAIWLLFLMTFLLSKSDIRASVAAVVRASFSWKVVAILAAMTLYTAALILGLYIVGFWQAGMIKDTAVWFMAVFVMVVRYTISYKHHNIIREVFIDSINLFIFIEFIVDTYVLPLLVELVLLPVVTCSALMLTVARSSKENVVPARILTVVLWAAGLFVLLYSISRASGDFRNLGTIATVRAVAFPPLMSILLVPFIYLLLCVLKYEELFARLGMGHEKSPALARYARRSMIFYCGTSLRRLHALRSHPCEIMQIESVEDVDRMLRSIDRSVNTNDD